MMHDASMMVCLRLLWWMAPLSIICKTYIKQPLHVGRRSHGVPVRDWGVGFYIIFPIFLDTIFGFFIINYIAFNAETPFPGNDRLKIDLGVWWTWSFKFSWCQRSSLLASSFLCYHHTTLNMTIPLESPQSANSNGDTSPLLPTGGVTDVNYHPLPGYVGNLTGAQLQTLDKLKEELKDQGLFVKERMDDAKLLRWPLYSLLSFIAIFWFT